MAATKCPNKNNPEWIRLIDGTSKSFAWRIFIANNEEVPEMSVIEDIIRTYTSDEKYKFLEDKYKRIENGMYRERSGKLVPMTSSYNPEVWWIEKQEKLVEMTKDGRDEKLFNWDKAHSKAIELNQKYKGLFKFEKELSVRPGVKVAKVTNAEPRNKKIYRIKVTQLQDIKYSKGPIINEMTFLKFATEIEVNDAISETKQLVKDTLKSLENRTISEAIGIINDLDIDDHIKHIINFLSTRLEDNPTLKFIIDNDTVFPDTVDEKGNIIINKQWGSYEVSQNVITIFAKTFETDKYPNVNKLGITFGHELLHAFTQRAFHNRYTERDIEFVATIERLFKIAKKQTIYKNKQAYESAEEWIAAVLVDGAVKNEAMHMRLNVWQRFILGIKKLIGITSVYDYALKVLTDHVNNATVFTPYQEWVLTKPRKFEEDFHLPIDNINSSHIDIWKVLDAFSKQFDFNEADHIYTHIPTNEPFASVHEALVRGKIESSKPSDFTNKNISVGNVIHGIAESDLKQIAINIAKSNGYEYEPLVVTKLEQILKQFKRPGVTILSEVLVADIDKKIAGTVDMIIIDENNQVHIYDFKTKIEKWADYLKETSYGLSPMTGKDRHAAQLSMYKDLFEKMTGLDVASLNIVALRPTIEKDSNIITDINLDKTHSDTGIIKLVNSDGSIAYNYSVNTAYKLLASDQGKTPEDEFDDDKVDPETRKELDDKLKERTKQLSSDLSELTAKEAIVNKSINALIHKKEMLYRTNRSQDIAVQEKLIESLLDEKDVEKQLLMIIQYANRNSERIIKEYNKYRDEGRQVPLKILYGWRDAMFAFEALTNEEEGLKTLISAEFGSKGGPEYRKLLNETVDTVNTVKSLYKKEGLDQLIDFLAPFYNRIYAEKRLLKIKEYRKLKFQGKVGNLTESQYVDNYINENEEDLQKETKTLMRTELKKASRDINVLTRWIDNLLDTTDPVSAAMVKAFAFADEDQRIGALEKRDEMVSLVRELESWYSIQGRVPKSMEEFYSFMLEKDKEGNLTGHYITSYTSGMIDEYRKVVRLASDEPTSDGRKIIINDWLDNNYPLDKDRFKTEFWSFIQVQHAEGKISDDSFTSLEQNNIYAKNKLSIGEMTDKGIITFEEGDILGGWLSNNTWGLRVAIDKWKNPQWEKLEKIKDDPDDPRGKFYKHILSISKQADKFIPFGFRLNTRLPGVIKQSHERISSGQGIGKTIIGGMKDQLTFRLDDTHRVHEEMFDEQDRPKYFLPLHFTGRVAKEVPRLDEEGKPMLDKDENSPTYGKPLMKKVFDVEEQSFDVATIYHKYWSMANDYNTKNNILPEMEMAKFMINTRKTEKRDRFGEKVLRKKTKRKGYTGPDEVATTNNSYLAEQVNDWFLSCVYGIQENDAGELWGMDIGKLLNTINKYTSLNLLGLNVVAGSANIILGETLQRIESFAMEYMTPADFLYADKFHLRTMKGVIGDIGARDATGLATHIVEQFGIFDEYGQADMGIRNKAQQLFKTDSLYATSRMGEHYMQTRFLFGLLANKRAYDKDGKDIGRMLDMYELKDNKLVIKDIVDLVKSKWTDGTNGTKDYQKDFKIKTRGILSRLHGEYGALGKVAIQRMALGRMAYLFRHFIVPGFRRRWGKSMYGRSRFRYKDPNTGKWSDWKYDLISIDKYKKLKYELEVNKELRAEAYSERLGQFVEGNYITTGKYLGNTFFKPIFGKSETNKEEAFFGRLIGNLQSYKLSLFGAEWAALTDHEKANIHRTIYEVGFLVLAIILANVVANLKGDDDDDENDRFYAFIAYQTYRLQNELLFFTLPTSAMSIMRSPAASFSVVENILKLSGQVFHPLEIYESGAWKGRPKILKTVNDMVPITKQWYRLTDIETQVPLIQQTAFGGRKDKEDKETTK